MTNKSPFAAKRYEYEGDHVYYLPPAPFGQLEGPVPNLIVGTRGTGKTTLLRALNWEERLYNSSLQTQLRGKPFEARYIGLYFKLPTVQLSLLERWLSDEPDEDYAALLNFHLDLAWLEDLGRAVSHLSTAGLISITAADDARFTEAFRDLWSRYRGCVELFGAPSDTREIFALMHPMRRALERLARAGAPVADVLDLFPAGAPGSFGRTIGSLASRALSEGDAADWSFRVCMDEGEVLTLRQQRAVNTALRLAEWPVFPVVAYVSRPLDVTTTFLTNQTLQLADRQILLLDEMRDPDFRKLVEGVANARIKQIGGPPSLSTRKLLGDLDLNGLLLRILRTSESVEAEALLAEAQAQMNSDDPHTAPPIYETYLRRHRRELVGATGDSPRDVRRRSSTTYRKQMVGAYLTICKQFGKRPLFASSEMLLQLCDRCVRDFLWQMDALFRAANVDIQSFAATTLEVATQDSAFREASNSKMALFQERVVSAPAEANQVVDGLARTTHEIQSLGRNYEQLRSPERGIFSYRLLPGERAEDSASNAAVIRGAAEAGYLRILPSDPGVLRFRVHASLAPKYRFSYRGAYYDVSPLEASEIASLREASGEDSLSRAIAQLVARLTGRRVGKNVGQMSLEEMPVDEWEHDDL